MSDKKAAQEAGVWGWLQVVLFIFGTAFILVTLIQWITGEKGDYYLVTSFTCEGTD